MTAEIAILNKSGIALAADSAVTSANKIYNSANKLFALSKYQPIGIMTYGNAELIGVPWEIIIKEYRNNYLKKKAFSTIDEYNNHFINYLQNENSYLSKEVQEYYFHKHLAFFCNLLEIKIKKIIKKHFDKTSNGLSNKEIHDISISLIDVINERFEIIRESKNENINILRSKLMLYSKKNVGVFSRFFKNYNFSLAEINKINNLFINYSINDFLDNRSGIVIAGYGTSDIYPQITENLILVKIKDKLISIPKEHHGITIKNNATIIPFAQSDMVKTFMEGMDPSHNQFLTETLRKLLRLQFKAIQDNDKYNDLSKKDKNIISEIIDSTSNPFIDKFESLLTDFVKGQFIRPTIDAVAMLPKDELAIMAETLVNLTKFKRKVSPVRETVGGPIDVAVISKGDGFVWIKRKHYFNIEYNPHFLKNYFNCEK